MREIQTNINTPKNAVTVAYSFVLAGATLWFGWKGAVLALFGGGAFFCVLLYPRLGLALTILAVINLQSMGRFGNNTQLIFPSIAKILGAITGLAWFVNVLRGRLRIYISPHIITGAVFVFFCLLSMLEAERGDMALADILKTLSNFMMYFLIANLIESPKQLIRCVEVIVFAAFISCLVAFAQHHFPSLQISGVESVIKFGAEEAAVVNPEHLLSGNFTRVCGTFGHSNWFSLFLTTVIALNLILFYSAKQRAMKVFSIIVFACEIVAAVLTHDRIGFIGITLVCSLLLWKKVIKLNVLLTPGIILCAIIFLYAFIPNTYIERVFSIAHYEKSESISARWELQMIGLDIFDDDILVGVGAGNFGPAFMTKNSKLRKDMEWLINKRAGNMQNYWMGAHNMYLEVGCETGLIGLLALLVFLGKGVYDLIVSKKLMRLRQVEMDEVVPTILIISLLGFFLAALFLHAQHQKIWWIVMGLSAAVKKIVERSPLRNPQPNDVHLVGKCGNCD